MIILSHFAFGILRQVFGLPSTENNPISSAQCATQM